MPFVGRREALTVLQQEATHARDGQPRIVWVSGEAGMGKTTLVRQFLETAPAHDVVWSSADETEQSLPFGVVAQLSGIVDPSELSHSDVFAVGADLVRELGSADGLFVAVVDDVQWIDPNSAAALLFAVRRLQTEPVLVVLASRPGGEDGLGDSWHRVLADEQRSRRIDIEGLDRDDLIELSASGGAGALSRAGAERLHAHTDGHPLHARVLLEELGAAGIQGATDVLPAPRSLAAITLGKAAGLAPDTQSFLAAGSVLGMVFDAAAAAAVADVETVDASVAESVTAGLLEHRAGGELAFAHPLLRGAIYNDMSAARQRELHAEAARHVTGVASLRHRVNAVVADDGLATELEEAAEAEIGSFNSLLAAEYLLDAARLSTDAARHDADILRATEAVFMSGQSGRARLLESQVAACAPSAKRSLVLAMFASASYRLPEAEVLYLEAAESTDPVTHAEALVGAASTRMLRGRWVEALEAVDAALDAKPEWSAGSARYAQVVSLMQLGRMSDARVLADELAQEGAPEDVADLDVLGARGLLKYLIEDEAGAERDLRNVVIRTRAGERCRLFAFALTTLAEVENRLGQWDDAIVNIELVTSLAYDMDLPLAIVRGHAIAAWFHAARGHFATAEAHLAKANEFAPFVPAWAGAMQIAIAVATLAEARADRTLLVDAGERMSALLGAGLEIVGVWRMRVTIVDALIAAGRTDDAADALDRLRTQVGTTPRATADLARVAGGLAEAVNDFDGAERVYDVPDDALAGSSGFSIARLKLAHGRLLRARGSRRAAIDALREARHAFERLGALPFVERCDEELTACGLRAPSTQHRGALALTPSEETVAHLVADGLTNREVASRLYVSTKAVEYHLGHIYAKLGISSRRQLAEQLRSAH